MTVDARVEHVGSLLRPGFLRQARDAYARGELTVPMRYVCCSVDTTANTRQTVRFE